MFCKECGTEIPVNSEFLYSSEYSCPKCGTVVKSAATDNSQGTAEKKSPFEYFIGAFKKYAVIKGRARRAEYWWFTLFILILSVAASIIDVVFNLVIYEGYGLINSILSLVVFLPSLCLSIRRFHDCDKRGWVMFIPIYSFVLLFFDGTPGENRFGEDPKGRGVKEPQ